MSFIIGMFSANIGGRMKKEDVLDRELVESEKRFYGLLLENASAIAEKKGFSAKDWNAFYVLFADRFGWTPSEVRSLTMSELSLFLHEFFPPESPDI